MYYATSTLIEDESGNEVDGVFVFFTEANVNGGSETQQFATVEEVLAFANGLPIESDIEELQPGFEANQNQRRVVEAAANFKALGVRTPEEGIVWLDQRISALETDDDGSDATLYRVALMDPNVGLLGSLLIQQSGTSYPALTRATAAAAADPNNDTVEKVQAAALAALGIK